MVANCVEVFLGATGIIDPIMSYVGPLTVTAYLCTLVTSLAWIFADVASASWGIALLWVLNFFKIAGYVPDYF